jgi:transcriptional regulator with PAS, ATPase and Fis domain
LAELADKGTLFLDEIGEIPQPLQAKLLRFLQERRFRRVGGTQDITVDVRIVAATNQDLARLVEDGRFRRDLFYRLNMITIPVPPLRERQEDILMLAQSFLEAANLSFRKCFRDIHPEAAALLTAYHWPGNIRELRNVIERVVLLEEDDLVHPHHLPREITGDRAGAPVAALAVPSLSPECSVERLFPQTLEAVETAYIQAVLGRVNGNKTRAAEILNITRQTLRLRLNGTAGSRHE